MALGTEEILARVVLAGDVALGRLIRHVAFRRCFEARSPRSADFTRMILLGKNQTDGFSASKTFFDYYLHYHLVCPLKPRKKKSGEKRKKHKGFA